MTDSRQKINHNIKIVVSCSDEDIVALSSSEECLIRVSINNRTSATGECPSEIVFEEQESTVEETKRVSDDTSEKLPHSAKLRRNMTLVRQSKLQNSMEENQFSSANASDNFKSEGDGSYIQETIDEEKEVSCEGIEESSDEWSIYSV